MKKGAWTRQIKAMMKTKQMNPDEYLQIIKTLADILEQRDVTYQEYLDGGCKPVVEYTNKAGATNYAKNPLLLLWDALNATALTYWRELGLTPSAYKKMMGDRQAGKDSASSLAAALMAIEKR